MGLGLGEMVPRPEIVLDQKVVNAPELVALLADLIDGVADDFQVGDAADLKAGVSALDVVVVELDVVVVGDDDRAGSAGHANAAEVQPFEPQVA